MPRLDHAAFESADPDAAAAFYEQVFGARIVKTEGHPVMAYVGNTGFAFHKAGVEWHERDHGIAVGLFFRDPDGHLLEAITYRSGDDPRRP
jgi:catechol 2,3-dioxygenase-like lactoylglutathione lyase family enzyme